MSKRLYPFLLFAALGVFALVPPPPGAGASRPDDLEKFKGNSCVACHTKELSTAGLSNRYLEWHLSYHKEVGVSCDKCHGGDPGTSSKSKSHEGVRPPADPQSTIHPANLPATCAACHEPAATAFTQSRHFQAVRAAGGGGPSCSTCHEHMASSVVTTAAEGAQLCARCHTTGSGTPAAKFAAVPAKAEEVMASIERANGMVVWANGLLDGARERKVNVAAEEKEMQAVVALLKEAKASWHAFSMVGVSEKADQAFERGTKVKDALRKKMGFG